MEFLINNDTKSCYDLISTKSKEIVTYDELKKVLDRNDSIKINVNTIQEQEKDLNYPTYKRFKIVETEIYENDTTISTTYFTLINENNEWKRVWNRTLEIVAAEKYNKGDYEGAINLYNKAIELNPFDGLAYEKLAWCYNESDKLKNNTTRQETLERIVSNLKHSISFEPDIPSHYNAMSMYYNRVDNPDLATEYLKKGLKLTTNKYERTMFLSNIGLEESIKNNMPSAKKYFNEALQIQPNDDFSLYNLGSIYNDEGNYEQAITYFEKVNRQTKLPDNLKSIFYYNYAVALKNSKDKEKSKEYILKALELSPSNESYKSLYQSIK